MATGIFSGTRDTSVSRGGVRSRLSDRHLTPADFGGAEIVDAGENVNVAAYFTAASSHSIANNDQSFIDSALDTASNIPAFIQASFLSGATQLYNVAPSLGNLFGGEYELTKTADVIQEYDDDLGKYYQEHEGAADTLGFLLSSLVPGIAGIKILNAGQKVLRTAAASGRFGENMAKAYRLKAPLREKLVGQAVKEMQTGGQFSLMNKNLLKGMGAGFGQNILEGVAYETAVAATMFDSPLLENQDMGDIISNIAFGGIVFGGIGGLLDSTRDVFKVKRALKGAEAEAKPWTHIDELVGSEFKTSDRLLKYYDQLHNMPAVPKVYDADRIAHLESLARKTKTKLALKIRADFGDLAGGDAVVQEQLYQASKRMGMDTVLQQFLGAKGISRLADVSVVEKELLRLERAMTNNLTDKTKAAFLDSNIAVTVHRNWGDDVGNVVGKMKAFRVVDMLHKGEKLTVKGLNVVVEGEAGYVKTLAKLKRPSAKKLDMWNTAKNSSVHNEVRAIFLSGQKLHPGMHIAQTDVPMLEQAYKQFDASYNYKLAEKKAGSVQFASKEDLLAFIKETKDEMVLAELKAKPDIPMEELGAKYNVRPKYILGEHSTRVEDDLFALDTYAKEYSTRLRETGGIKADAPDVNLWEYPQHAKVVHDTTAVEVNGHIVEGIAAIKQRQKEYLGATDRIAAGVLPKGMHESLPDVTESLVQGSNSFGSGARFVSSAGGNYGGIASVMQHIGNMVNKFIGLEKTRVRETFEATLGKLVQNPEAAIEFSTHQALLRSIPMNYGLNKAGNAFIPTVLKRYQEALAAGKKVKPPKLAVEDAPLSIPIKHQEARDLAKMHIEVNGMNRSKQVEMRTAQGMEHKVDTDVFYPIPVDSKAYPFFATVTDDAITGTGHTSTIYAASEQKLQEMILKLENKPGLTVRTKREAEEYWSAVGQFDYDKTLHDNYMDAALKREGVSSPYYIPTDPQKIAEEFLNWHSQRAAGMVREGVSLKYEKAFTELRTMGDAYTNVATSKLGSLSGLKHAEAVVENPFMDYVRTALSIKNYADYPFWTSANRAIDAKLSQMYAKITGDLVSSKSNADLDKINETLTQAGWKGAGYDAEMELLANHTAPRGVLSSFIQKSNALLATVILRLDALNAVNNTVGSYVLLGSETKAVTRAIEAGSKEAVGELASLSKIALPGTDKLVKSPTKMIAKAIRAFSRSNDEMKFFKDNGFVSTISDQYAWTLDQLTLAGRETAGQLESKITNTRKFLIKAADKGEELTGNRVAEEFNRFVAAHVMKQMTDVAVKHNLMDSKTALAYINTFVNRTQGNYLASQRPMMFQGPVGQAIGLFQTYQFNLMQQLLRHVGEGPKKDYMTLLGLQGTIYGMNGMPAFNAINTHVIGTASGNKEHKDAYDLVYGGVGKNAGDWLMYGMASNILLHPDLKVNLYVRGDINPRHVTIVPTNPADVPIYGAYSKFIGNIYNTTKKMFAGGDISSVLLQGIEHNGVSRPLAGLAQTLQAIDNPSHAVYSTSNRGNVIAANDFLSLVNMGRLVGGKPLGEAIAIDAAFRYRTYAAADQKRRQVLGSAVKSSMIAGRVPTQEQIDDFAEAYVKTGGKQTEYNKWMLKQYSDANTSQVNALQDANGSKFNQSMQTLMGGYELRDFSEGIK